MSQTVKIDAAAQDAIAEIVGMPWEKDYFDNTHDKDSAHIATVTREGTSVRIYVCDESLCSADFGRLRPSKSLRRFSTQRRTQRPSRKLKQSGRGRK